MNLYFLAFDCSSLSPVFDIIQIVYTIIQIAVPIALIIMGSIDFFKAVMAGKDDALSKAGGIFMKRVIAAVIFFLLTSIVSLAMTLFTQGSEGDWKQCWYNAGIPDGAQG